MKFRKTDNRKLPLGYFWTHSINKTLLGLALRVADILHHMKLVSRASRPGLLDGFLRILCNGLCTCTEISQLQSMITPAVLDAQMNLTLSLITMSVPGCVTSFYLSEDMLRYCHREIIFT